MSDEKPKNVYGENHPASEDRGTPGIRDRTAEEKGTDETLEETRNEDVATGNNSGGMGRENTPRDGTTQGRWDRPEADKR